MEHSKFVEEVSDKRIYVASSEALAGMGVTIPKAVPPRVEDEDAIIFGQPLEQTVKACSHTVNNMIVPRFIAELVEDLSDERKICTEGLFRVSGSAARVKSEVQAVQNGEVLEATEHVHDRTTLLKKYLRNLPEGLMNDLYGGFVQAAKLPRQDAKLRAALLLCRLMRKENIHLMRYIFMFLHNVTQHENKNKMNANNLALMIAPNVLYEVDPNAEETNHCVQIVEILIANAVLIGTLPMDVYFTAMRTDEEVAARKYKELKEAHRRRRSSIKEIGVEALRRLGSAGASVKNKLSKARPDSSSSIARASSVGASDKKGRKSNSSLAADAKAKQPKPSSPKHPHDNPTPHTNSTSASVHIPAPPAGHAPVKPARRKAQEIEHGEQAGPRVKRQPSLPTALEICNDAGVTIVDMPNSPVRSKPVLNIPSKAAISYNMKASLARNNATAAGKTAVTATKGAPVRPGPMAIVNTKVSVQKQPVTKARDEFDFENEPEDAIGLGVSNEEFLRRCEQLGVVHL